MSSIKKISDDDLRHQHGRGPNSIFILDTSASLGPDGFDQMKQTFTTMIDGNVSNFQLLFKHCVFQPFTNVVNADI